MAGNGASKQTDSRLQHKVLKEARKARAAQGRFVDRMLSYRNEMKYLVSDVHAEAIASFVRSHIELDRYSKLQRGGMYPITSLYIDSPDLQLCKESLDGKKNRFKLRVRGYTDEPEYPRFFEIKRRINTIIIKSRARVMDQDVVRLLAGRTLGPQSYRTDVIALNQFQLYARSINAGPKILIRYLRQAFENDSENRVRVTFDRELYYCVVNEPIVRLGGTGWQRNILTEGSVILEIKFSGTYPSWLTKLVKCFDLRQRSISKYATSISQACRLGFCAPVI